MKTTSQRGRTAAILFVLSLTTLMSTIDTTIVNIGLPSIVRSLHTSFAGAQWVALGYMLALTSLIVGIGRLGDLFGKKPLFLAGIALFTVSSFFCGLSGSIGLLIAMRIMQGLGGAFMVALAFALAADLLAPAQLMSGMGILTAMMPLGIALGPPVGGVLIAVFGWPSIFLLNVPLGVLAFWMAWRFPPSARALQAQRFDVRGLALLAATLVCYSLAITLTESEGASLRVLLLFAGAAAGIAAFILIERRTASPLVPLRLFASRPFSGSLAMGVLLYTVITGANMILPFYLQQAKGYGSAAAGGLLFFGPLGCAVFSAVSGQTAERFGHRLVMLCGVAGFSAGVFVMSLFSKTAGPVLFAVIYFAYSGCFAFFQTPNNATIVSQARPEERGLSSALLNLSRSVGQTTGTAVLGAVFATFTASAVARGATTAAQQAAVAYGVRCAMFIAGIISAAAFFVGFFTLKDTPPAQDDTEPPAAQQ